MFEYSELNLPFNLNCIKFVQSIKYDMKMNSVLFINHRITTAVTSGRFIL